MKPDSLLDSDPVNIFLAQKPKIPFAVPEEVPNGSYGLIINGYSLVGNTELQLCFLLPGTLSSHVQPGELQEASFSL